MMDIEQLRKDWKHDGGDAPEVDLDGLRRRLSRRWIMLAVEGLISLGVLAFLVATALHTQGLMGWIYWGFFATFFLVAMAVGTRARLGALFRPDDSATSILAHAWRDTKVRETGGIAALWACPLVWLFVLAWLLVDAVLQGVAIASFPVEYWQPIAFVTAWCLPGTLLGALMREKGRRQRLELQRLANELLESDRFG